MLLETTEISWLVDDTKKYYNRLTAKEISFIENIERYLVNGYVITDKQYKYLKSVHEKATDVC